MKRKKLIASLTVLSVLLSNNVVFADNQDKIKENNKKIESMNNQKKELEKQKDNVNYELMDVLSKIDDKESEINGVQQNIDNLQGEINSLQISITENEAEVLKTEERIKETEALYKEKEAEQKFQEEVLSERLKRNYMNDTYNEFLGIILNSSSLSEVLFKVKYVSNIVSNDKDVINNLKEIKAELAIAQENLKKDKEDLNNRKISLEYEKNLLSEKQDIVLKEKDKLDDEMNNLKSLENDKQSKISRLSSSQSNLQNEIQDLTVENAELSNFMKETSSSSSGVTTANGSFIRPTSGTYTSMFGPRVHPILKTQSFHHGIDIANSKGTSIVAADGGTVVRANYSSSYGNVVVVDHGNGYSTLYAHLDYFSVSNGQSVNQGQTLGGMGTTGWSTGPHLHYEVWINGEAVNPIDYL